MDKSKAKKMAKGAAEYRSKVASGEIEATRQMTPQEKFEHKPTPLNAIYAFCMECIGEVREEIKYCTSWKCQFRNFRKYKLPNEENLTMDEQKVISRAFYDEVRRNAGTYRIKD